MNIGLTFEEIDSILIRNGIEHGNVVSAEGHRKAIADAIIANNEKLLADVGKLISTLTNKGHL